MSSRDPYAVLGLSPAADDVVIRAAWKALLRKYHPDTSTEPNAAARTIEINQAFALIGKPEARAAFDRARTTRPAPPPPRPAAAQPHRPKPAWRPAPMPVRPPMTKGKRLGLSAAAAVILVLTPSLLIARRAHLFTFPGPIEWVITKAKSVQSLDDFRTRLRIKLGLEGPALPPQEAQALPDPRQDPVPRLDSEATIRAVQAFDQALDKGGFALAVATSKACAQEAEAHSNWAAADRCYAFDVAGEAAAGAMGQAAASRYFTAASAAALPRYSALTTDSNAIADRLQLVRDGIWPTMIDHVADRLHAAAANSQAPPAP